MIAACEQASLELERADVTVQGLAADLEALSVRVGDLLDRLKVD